MVVSKYTVIRIYNANTKKLQNALILKAKLHKN